MEELSPRVALVTGGTVGLGRCIATALARRGWSLFLQHVATDSLAEVVDELQGIADEVAAGGEVAAGQANLTIGEDREQLVEQALEVYGRIDMLVNAAPSAPNLGDDLLEMTEDAFRDALDSGLVATVFLTQRVASEMVRLAEGGLIEDPRIVTINSISAYAASMDHGPQCMARAAVGMMTSLFADRLGAHGVNVYEVRVGIISSGAGDTAHARYEDLIEDGLTPIRRWGRPGDVARAVLAVADGLLDFSTGEVINVDGGFHLRRL